MSQELMLAEQHESNHKNETGALLVGAGLAVASMILVPAVAMRLGLSASLTGALRIALMKASSKAVNKGDDESGTASVGVSCH